MNVTKLEILLSALLVVIVCEAGHYLPGFLASYCRGPVIVPTASNTGPQVIAEVTPNPYPPTSRGAGTVPLTQQRGGRVENVLQYSSQTQNAEAQRVDQIPLPLALVDPPDGFLTSREQVAAFDMLRQQFADSLSDLAQDPSTPEYRRQWLESQEMLDEQFVSLFGVEAYSQQQNVVMRAAAPQP